LPPAVTGSARDGCDHRARGPIILAADPFAPDGQPGEYVSISGHDGHLQTFRVVTVYPVPLLLALTNSFEMELKA